ncbi:MAG: polyhydroxybutyrate depolymerase [Actinomycetota bacterium]|nr:polyhydroxybutyrate depolymerase [Actinomycetota bacterium]
MRPRTRRPGGRSGPSRVASPAWASLALAAWVSWAVAGCAGSSGSSPPPGPGPAVQNRQFSIDGVVRSYRVYAPPTVGARRLSPLLVVLHGGGDSVTSTVDTTMFDRQAQASNYIVAYPEGTRLEWNAGFCCGTAPSRNVDDVGFLNQVLDRLEADYPIDRARIFLAGVSNGAMLAYRFACEHAERVTAVGSVAGSMVLDSCHPSRPVSVIEVHGTADPLVPFQGGHTEFGVADSSFSYSPIMALSQRWADLDGCPPSSAVTTSGPVVTMSWVGCHNGSAVSLVSVTGGGHVWFAPGLGSADGSLDATQVIGTFLARLRPVP